MTEAHQNMDSLLYSMSMPQLVDVMEAFGEQGLGGCGRVADFVAQRYEDNGGRMSRRDTSRSLRSLAVLGEVHDGLLRVLLGELAGWIEQDPTATHMQTRPALSA